MIGVFAMSIWMFLLSAGFVVMGWTMTLHLAPEHRRSQMIRWLVSWSAKGLGVPCFIWGVMNIGISWQLQPFMPSVQAAMGSGGGWFLEWMRALATGLFVISSYWAAGTLGWVLSGTDKAISGEARKDFRALVFTCAAGLGIPALLIFLVGGWAWLGVAAAIILGPAAGYAPTIVQPKKIPPMYARAIARIKFGKYSEAEWEIIRELEKSENDFEGWMMLAELYATRFNDVAEAERTVLEVCDQPRLTPSQLSVSLHRLADWQLKIASDPEAARRALQMIVDRLKGTHLARMALLRLNQIPISAQQWKEQQAARPIPLPALGDSLDRSPDRLEPPSRKQAAGLANSYVEQLKRDPNDVAAREKLARVFAEQLDRADLGLEQLRLLLNMPEQQEYKRAEWLSLIAAWELKYTHNPQGARRTLERIVEEFPTSPQALAARRRLALMQTEIQGAPESGQAP